MTTIRPQRDEFRNSIESAIISANKEFVAMWCARCCRLVSAGLVCACLAQGAKAPPAAVVGAMVGPVVTQASTNAVSADQYVADTVTGRVYKISGLAERSPIGIMPSTTAMAPFTVTVASTSPGSSMTVPSTGAYD